MPYLIGTDEAGYGPNLGPLVVSATVWQVTDGVSNEDLHDRLAAVVTNKPGRPGDDGVARLAMADSKVLYAPGKGLGNLERGLLAALAAVGHCPRTWRDLFQALDPACLATFDGIPWYAGYDRPLPIDGADDQLGRAASIFDDGIRAAGIRLLGIRSRAVFPGQFNRLLREHESKGAALSHVTLGLAAEVAAPLAAGPISVVCDKHGGRNRYGPLLEDHFPDVFVERCGEGRQQSVYRFGPAGRRVEFCFRTKAESCLAAALASMASKYLRELAMGALNAFWGREVPGLKPTAGYPVDARRFKAAIADRQVALGIPDETLWRSK